jgi:hypothetical protein
MDEYYIAPGIDHSDPYPDPYDFYLEEEMHDTKDLEVTVWGKARVFGYAPLEPKGAQGDLSTKLMEVPLRYELRSGGSMMALAGKVCYSSGCDKPATNFVRIHDPVGGYTYEYTCDDCWEIYWRFVKGHDFY